MSTLRTAARRPILAILASLSLVPLALTQAAPAQAAAFVITGDVIDNTNAAVAGVTVRPLGGSAATTTTDAEGEYALTLPAGRWTIEYAKAGYATTTYDGVSETVLVVDGAGNASVEIDDETEPVEDNVLDSVTLLPPAPSMVKAPTLVGKAVAGETVEATTGTWNPDIKDVEAGEDWRDYVTVEWFLDGEPADDFSDGYYFQQFEVPAEAGGQDLSFRITIEDDASQWAPIVYTSSAVAVPRAKASLKASYAAGKLKVTVTVAGLDKPVGTITVLEGKKKVGSAKLAAKGKGVASVKVKLKKGKHKLTVSFDGGDSVDEATAKIKVKIA